MITGFPEIPPPTAGRAASRPAPALAPAAATAPPSASQAPPTLQQTKPIISHADLAGKSAPPPPVVKPKGM